MNQLEFKFPDEVLDSLRTARRVAVLTGAGISAESGVPTFRDAQTGLWAKYKPEDLATPEAFRHNPRLVWEWYAWRRQRVGSVAPNPGHLALAEMERRVPEFTLVTQNVDGLHQRAGSRQVIELHGNISRTKCFHEDVVVETWGSTEEVPPRCPRCGGLLRPDVVWFGEMLPPGSFEQALAASQTCDLFFSIGTSALVFPAASLPYQARQRGAVVVEVNPDATVLTAEATYSFRGPSGKLLPALVQATWAT
jgi:NAD-dependent deacetylase